MKRLELNIKCCAECPYCRDIYDGGGNHNIGCDYGETPLYMTVKDIDSIHSECPLPSIPQCPSCNSLNISPIMGKHNQLYCRECRNVKNIN